VLETRHENCSCSSRVISSNFRWRHCWCRCLGPSVFFIISLWQEEKDRHYQVVRRTAKLAQHTLSSVGTFPPGHSPGTYSPGHFPSPFGTFFPAVKTNIWKLALTRRYTLSLDPNRPKIWEIFLKTDANRSNAINFVHVCKRAQITNFPILITNIIVTHRNAR